MRRTIALLLALVLASVALAGCMGNDDEPPATTSPATTTPVATTPATTTPVATTPVTTTPGNGTPPLDASSYALAVNTTPSQVRLGEKLNFTLYVNGSVTSESDHVGAHYADNDTSSPPVAGRQDCEHRAGALPGVFNVTCTFNAGGTWYVWGHARVNDSGTQRDWWAASPFVVKARAYNATLTAPTAQQESGEDFTVTVNVTALSGSDNATGVVNVYHFNATTATPTTAAAAGACTPVPGGVVGVHTITCNITHEGALPGPHYLRAHVSVADNGTTLDWWSAETSVTVGAVGLPGIPGP